MLTVTKEAETYLVNLLETKSECIGVKLGVSDGGTPLARTALSYCKVGDVNSNYQIRCFGDLDVYIEVASEEYLKDAVVHYDTDNFGGQLTIKAPNSKAPKISENATLEERVTYALWTDVWPIVEPHGGTVKLIEITEDMIAIVEFGGGCQGCTGIDITLKEGVEKALSESVPEIKGIRDITDHTDDTNAYFKPVIR